LSQFIFVHNGHLYVYTVEDGLLSCQVKHNVDASRDFENLHENHS